MIADDLRRLVMNQPFQRFRMNLANGDIIEVQHPDFLLIDPRGRTLTWYPTDAQVVEGCRSTFIDTQLIVSIDVDSVGGARQSADANAA